MKQYYLLPLLFLVTACAQFVPPTGGDKDETPPKLIKSIPESQTKNFHGRSLFLEFDELIDANSIRQELIITPQIKGTYSVKAKPYSVELKFDKDFEDSTTYTVNFRSGITDLNERNPATNLKVVFSTSDLIDSLSISGNVKNLLTGENSKETTLALYDLNSIDTIPLLKQKPKYFIQTDTSGNYEFENLKASQYRLIAFTDKNKNLFYENKTEWFGYKSDTINLKENIDNVNLTVYPNFTEEPKIDRSLSRQSNYSIRFNKSIETVKVQFLEGYDSLTYKLSPTELLFFNHPALSDTTLTKLLIIDSLGNTLETEQKIYFNNFANSKPKSEPLRITFKDLKPNQRIKKPSNYTLQFEYPITYIDTTKISILADTTDILSYSWKWLDISQTALQINFEQHVQKEIALKIESAALTNYKSDTNSTYQLINSIYQQDELGAIDGKFEQFDGPKIIQLLEGRSNELVDEQRFTDKFSFPHLIPGTYKIRIIQDTNDNGRWDTGNFDTNLPPENIFVSKGILKVKSNFQLSDIIIE